MKIGTKAFLAMFAALAALCLASPATSTTVLSLSPAQVDALAQRIVEVRRQLKPRADG